MPDRFCYSIDASAVPSPSLLYPHFSLKAYILKLKLRSNQMMGEEM